jgi:hypothetical protein
VKNGDPRVMRALSLEELQVILSDEIARVRAGETTHAQANAVSNAAGKIMSSVRLELEYARLSGRVPKVKLLEERDRA